jgi:hypothetical protein
MNEMRTILEQTRVFAEQHLPPELVGQGLALALVLLLAGVGLCVLGAKLARWGITGAFVLLGAVVGLQFSRVAELPPWLCLLLGAVLIGTIGHLTFRIWTGAIAAACVAALALGAVSFYRVIPHLPEFENQRVESDDQGLVSFSVPTADEQKSYVSRQPQQWVRDFWSFAASRDAQLRPLALAVGLLGAIGGFLFGLLACRATLILATSLVGTGFVVAGIGMLVSHLVPTFYESATSRSSYLGAGIGGFLLISLILQTLLTRKARPAAASTQSGKA